ncbi:MAG: glycosyltransferase family 4 protein [Myxococcota bacterium]|nr:glycosyltransferase family 4 protein [Myxococcota bacterium]
MRIAYVCSDPGVPAFGTKGASNHLQAMLRAFCRLGHDVVLLTRRPGGPSPPELALVRVVELGKPPPSARGGAAGEQWLLDSNRALDSLLCGLGDLDLVYERHSLFAYAAMEHARTRNIPGLLEVNAPLVEEQERHRSLFDRSAAEAAAERACNAASAVLAVSSPLACRLRAQVAEPGRVHVVPNGVDLARFRAVSRAQTRPFTVGFVGSLRPWHGLETLADAFGLLRARLPEARLRVIGDGPGRAALEQRLAGLDALDSSDFSGAIPQEEVPAALAGLDVALAPYPELDDFYFSPLKLYEYMAAGCAVVASEIGQVRDVIDHEVDGILVPPGDAEAIAHWLARLAGAPELRERLGANARAKMCGRDWVDVAHRVLRLATQ